MAYENLKGIVIAESIERELPKFTVLEDDCNRKFEGLAKMNETVKILGAARPTVGTYVPGTNMSAAETPSDTSVYLKIDQFKYTNIEMEDIDKMQSKKGAFESFIKGNAEVFAEVRDTYIATMAQYAANLSTSAAITTAAGAKTAIDTAFVALWDNGVKINADVVIDITPWFYNLFKDKLTELYTNNVELIRKGIVGMYNGAMVKITNNLYNNGTDDFMMIRTKDAIAFAAGIHESKGYSPDLKFVEAIKTLDTFGAKVVRPKELYTIKARKA